MPSASDATAPRGNWLLGHLPALLNRPLALLDACAGAAVPLRLGKTAWLILEPSDVQHILTDELGIYTKGRAFSFGGKLYGNSMLVSEGAEHQQQAKLVGGLFYEHAASSFLQPAIDVTVAWRDRWVDGEPFDLWQALVELTLAISSRAIFGDDYLPDWLTSKSDDRVGDILNSYDVAMGHVAKQNFSLLPLPDWIPTPANRRYNLAIRLLNDAFADSVRRREGGRAEGGFLDVLLREHREAPDTLSRNELRDQALVLTLGGYESSASTLCWSLLLIGRDPAIDAAVREEIYRVCPTDAPTAAIVEQLEYTACAFSETLRLYPPPWLIPRTPSAEDTLPCGQTLKAGTQVFLSPYRTQRDPRWFADPLRFDPARFANGRAKELPPGSYIPFGGGRRRCIGESVSRRQLVLILASLLKDHRFELVDGVLPAPAPVLTLRPAAPVMVRMQRVSD